MHDANGLYTTTLNLFDFGKRLDVHVFARIDLDLEDSDTLILDMGKGGTKRILKVGLVSQLRVGVSVSLF